VLETFPTIISVGFAGRFFVSAIYGKLTYTISH
jgi:hypothetical protein